MHLRQYLQPRSTSRRIILIFSNFSIETGAQTITLDARRLTLNPKSSPEPFTIQVPLLSGPAKLSVQATADLQICLQRGLKVRHYAIILHHLIRNNLFQCSTT